MAEEADRDVTAIDYDRTSRHRLLADVVTELLPAEATILDIGGAEGLTGHFLPGYRVVTLDISARARVDILASAGALPFPNRAFDAVTGLDLLEHVPAELRPAVLAEAARTSRELVVFAGPYEDPGVAETEQRVQEFFVSLFEQPNEWLAEHADMGRPDFTSCERSLVDQGMTVSSFGSNPLELWSMLQKANFVATRIGALEAHGEMNRRLFEELLGSGDAIAPSYRRFLVATQSGRKPSAAVADAAREEVVAEWQHRLEIHLAALVNQGTKQLSRQAEELEERWRRSREKLDRRWKRDAERLQEGWQGAARRADIIQRTMYAYEQALCRGLADWREAVRGVAVTADVAPVGPDRERYRRWVAARQAPLTLVAPGPRFSILTPVFNPDSRFLESCIRSVRAQTYPHWQLVLADVSTDPHVAPICRRFSLIDDRITVVKAENRGIAVNTDLAAHHADGEWLVFLDHDDELAPHALAAVARVIEDDPEVDFVYSDEDKLDVEGKRVDPFFKPDWSPDLLHMVNYVGHLTAMRRSLFDAVGQMREGYDGAQDFDLQLRATHRARRVAHIPDVLYHWRQHEMSTATDVRVKPDAHGAGRRALQDFADEHVPGAWVDLGPGPTTHRLRYPMRTEKVAVVIPFRDAAEVTDACLESISRHFNALPFEVLLVSNQSREEKTFAYMENWERNLAYARCLEYDQPFNFHALNNWAVGQAEGSMLLFLNNDVEVLHDAWIDELAEHAQRPEVGVVGSRLFYPNGLVQHAGVVVGIGGFAEHPWRRLHPDEWTPAGPSYWVRNFLSVTAACMMIERAKFEQVGGFDERFLVCGGDVDLGLRLHQAGYWNVMTPFVRLVHHESLTRDPDPPEVDVQQSLRAYAPYRAGRDPFYNPNLTLVDTTCQIADP